ncbi:MAG: flavodoxin family protein [Proteobacteria bacterium]|nr:flavodoxin family protein [Pseudomonadota bacterium]
MKILGLVCSPREGGNTEIMVREALDEAARRGAETELVLLAGKNITPCQACEACMAEGVCAVDDDMQAIYSKLVEADGILFGTPVYFINVTAQAKAVIDRSFALMMTGRLRGKAAAAVVVARRVGAGQVLSLLYTWFAVHGMHVAGGAIGYGREKGEVREGPGGSPGLTALDEARGAGKNVVRTIERLAR